MVRGRPGYIFSWATDKLGDAELPEVLEDTNGVQVEKVAALAPDLIIGQYSGLTEKDYELLSKIAPTVAQSGDYADYGAPWDEMALTIGMAVGQPSPDAGDVDGGQAADHRRGRRQPGVRGASRPMVVLPTRACSSTAPRTRARGCSSTSASSSRPSCSAESGEESATSLSAERTSDLDQIDVAVWLDLEADAAVKKVFDQTTTSGRGPLV